MFKRNAIAVAVGSVALFSGCAAPPQSAKLTVEPIMSVRNGGVEAERMYRIGRQYQGQQRLADAEESFLKALALDANHAEARNALAVTYFEQGLIQKAEQQFKLAIAAAPKRAHLHNNLGYLYQQIGRDDEAVSAYSEALLADPGNQRALDSLAALTCWDKSVCTAPAAATSAPVADSNTQQQVEAQQPATQQAVQAARQPAPATAQLTSVAPNVWELQPLDKTRQTKSESAQLASSNMAPEAGALIAKTVPWQDRRFEVANGNGVTGLAKRVGSYLHEQGFVAPRLTNHRTFKQQHTEVQYVPGAESLARRVSGSFDGPARLVAVDTLDRQVPVRLVLGKDFNESQSIAKGRRPSGNRVALALTPEQK